MFIAWHDRKSTESKFKNRRNNIFHFFFYQIHPSFPCTLVAVVAPTALIESIHFPSTLVAVVAITALVESILIPSTLVVLVAPTS